jgi:hypothetical protein
VEIQLEDALADHAMDTSLFLPLVLARIGRAGATSALLARQREKVWQLLENPHGLGGIVVVVGFTLRQILVSIHRYSSEVANGNTEGRDL